MTDNPTAADTSAQGRYATLKSERDPYTRRAEDAARLTIPSLFPPEGSGPETVLYQPYQSVGAKGVNSLAAKFLLALFPPGSSFFRLALDDKVLDELAEEMGEDEEGLATARTTMEAGLARVEDSVLTRMEHVGARAPLFDTARHLIVPGNVLLQILPGGKLRNHYLDDYVCKRDPEGTAMEIIVKECFALATLPENVREVVNTPQAEQDSSQESPKDTVDVYTRLTLVGDKWKVYQEVMGKRIPGTDGEYKKDECPYIPLRFTRIEGESYGRGMVEEYSGDLMSLESLSQSLVEFAGIAANIKFLIDPAGVTKGPDLARSKNGAFVKGTLKDIGVLSLDKFADFRVAKEMHDALEQRLGEAFLVGTSAVRDAERVTAEEIRLIASELEQALGGFYSVMAVELQLPLVARLLVELKNSNALPELPKDSIRLSIVTGMEALGRAGDDAKLNSFLKELSELVGPEQVMKYLNIGELLSRKAIAKGINAKGLIRSPEEIAQSDQQASAQEMVGKLGPQMLKNAQESQMASSAQPIPE